MLLIDVDGPHGQIRISGPEVETIMASADSAYIQVVLGWERTGALELSCSTEAPLALVLVPALRFLKRRGIDVQLNETARVTLADHLDYLRSFEAARQTGMHIEKENLAFEPGPAFKRELKPYQTRGSAHIAALPYAANFSVPGSGKTTMVLAAYSTLTERGIVEKLLVVGPRAAFEPWEEEFIACFGRCPRVGRISGDPETRSRVFDEASNYEIFLSTYQMFANELDNFRRLLTRYRMMFVIDESHHVKKGPGGIWFDSIFGAAPLAARRVVLSGTPAPNSISDLKAQLDILWPHVPELESIFQSIGDLSTDLAEVRASIKPLYTRIKKSELDLPPKMLKEVHVSMGVAQEQIYRALAAEVLRQLQLNAEETSLVRDLRRALIIRLIQAATNPSLLKELSTEFKLPPLPSVDVGLDSLILDYSKYETPPKFLEASKLVADIVRRGRKTLVWTSFIANAYSVAKLLSEEGVRSYVVTGLLPKEDPSGEEEALTRAQVLGQFKVDKRPCALVATVQSVGESVSLHTACLDAVYVDRTFNCGLYMQSMDRIHRIGIPRDASVRYHVLVTNGTIDEVINRRLNEKMELMHRLLNDDIGILTLEAPADDPLSETGAEDIQAVRDYLAKLEPHNSPEPR